MRSRRALTVVLPPIQVARAGCRTHGAVGPAIDEPIHVARPRARALDTTRRAGLLFVLVLTGCLPESRFVAEEWQDGLDFTWDASEWLYDRECYLSSATDAALAAAPFARRPCEDTAECESLVLPVWSSTDRWYVMGPGVHDGRRGLIALARQDAAGRDLWVIDDAARAVFAVRGSDLIPPVPEPPGSLVEPRPVETCWANHLLVGRSDREDSLALCVDDFASNSVPGVPMVLASPMGRDHLGPAGALGFSSVSRSGRLVDLVSLAGALVPGAEDGVVLEDRFVTEHRTDAGGRTLIVQVLGEDSTVTSTPLLDDTTERASIARGIGRLAWLELTGPSPDGATYATRMLVSAPEPAGDPFVPIADARIELGPGPLVELELGSTHAAFVEDGAVHVIELSSARDEVIPPRAEPWEILYVGPTEIALALSQAAPHGGSGGSLVELRFVRLSGS